MRKVTVKILSAVIAGMMLLCAFAFAEEADEGADALPSGETVFETNGIGVTYNKYNFKCDMDEHGNLKLTYLGDSEAPVRVGIKYLEGNTVEDVLDGMKSTIKENNADVSTDNFGDNIENATSVAWQKNDGKKTLYYQTTLIPKKNGVYILSIESYATGDTEADNERNAMLEEVVDSVRLTGKNVKKESSVLEA